MPPSPLTLFDRQLEIAAWLWCEIRTVSLPADRWLGSFFHHERNRFGAQDRRFYAETMYSLFRNKIFLKTWAEEIFPEGDEKFLVFLAVIRESLVSPDLIMEFSGNKNWPLTNGMVKAICAQQLPSKIEKSGLPPSEILPMRYSYPQWLIDRWIKIHGLETCQKLLETAHERPPFVERANPVKISREALMEKFSGQEFRVKETPQSPYGIIFEERANLFDSEEFRGGLFEIQDEGSQLLCTAMEPKPGELIWDACAGGGGKTLLLAALMQNKGRIIATDIRAKKLDELAQRAKRAGIYNIFPADLNRMSEISHARKGFDKILVDAPCSGTGTLRRNPDAKWKLSEKRILECQKDQLAILETVLPYLRKGGRIYYATCSMEPEENEEVMKEFLKLHPGLKPVAAGKNEEFLRLFPHLDQTDGFFLGIAENQV